jgi:hypothetical protein
MTSVSLHMMRFLEEGNYVCSNFLEAIYLKEG